LVTIAGAFLNEKALQPLGRDLVDQCGRITRRAGHSHSGLVDIASKDLNFRRCLHNIHVLAQQNGDRVGLLAGRATRDPHANLVTRALALEQFWYDLGLESLKGLGIAEKIGNPDQ
jgi:hypothetical protein